MCTLQGMVRYSDAASAALTDVSRGRVFELFVKLCRGPGSNAGIRARLEPSNGLRQGRVAGG